MTDRARIALLAVLASGGLLLASCSEQSGTDGHDVAGDAHAGHDHAGHDPADGDEAVDDVYENILGIVVSLPRAGAPGSELRIRHEHIPDFKSESGEVFVSADGVRGMKAMEMPFPIAEDLDISSLNVGDIIRFDFVVTWGTPRFAFTRFEKLDPATVIDFSNKVTEHLSDDAEQP